MDDDRIENARQLILFSFQLFIGYVLPCGDMDEQVEGEISEFHLRRAIEHGVFIRRVVVVSLASTGDYVPWIRTSDAPNYLRLSTRKYEGPKTFKDFRILQRNFAAEFGFVGRIHLCPEGDPFLRLLNIKV